jgi:hypothetical protein
MASTSIVSAIAITSTTNYLPSSPYYSTPQINIDNLPYLAFWKEIFIRPSTSDTLMTLDAQYQYRADLLSYNLYGTPQLWWIFMLRNPNVIRDPIWDFITGIMIYVPAKTSLSGYL